MKQTDKKEKEYQKKLKSGKMEYIKKYKIELEVLSKEQKATGVTELILDVLKDYFLEGSVIKSKEVKLTKAEVENWVDFDDDET